MFLLILYSKEICRSTWQTWGWKEGEKTCREKTRKTPKKRKAKGKKKVLSVLGYFKRKNIENVFKIFYSKGPNIEDYNQCFHLKPGTGACISPAIAIKSPAMNFPSMGLMLKNKLSCLFYINSVSLSFAGMYSRSEHVII